MSSKHVQRREGADFCQDSVPAKAQRDREEVGVEGPEVLRLKVSRAKQSSRGLFFGRWEDFAGDVRVAQRSNRIVVGVVSVGRKTLTAEFW